MEIFKLIYMLLILLFPLLFAKDQINWEDPNLKIKNSEDSKLEAQVPVIRPPMPLKRLPKQPKINDLAPQELDSPKNK